VRELFVRNRFAVGNLPQLGPHGSLKLRAFRDKRQGKGFALARKVLAQLLDDASEERTCFRPARIDGHGMSAVGKADVVQPVTRARKEQASDRTFIPG